MKKIIIIALLAVAAVSSLAAWQTRGRQKGRAGELILYDFREESRAPAPSLTPAAEGKILSAVFHSYLKKPDDCKEVEATAGSDDYLSAARKAGQFVPSVVARAEGSFTAAGEQQTAYVISVGECNASHADNYGTKRLVVFSGQKLVADVDADFNSDILRIFDLNRDGVNELLLGGRDMNQGIVVEVAALVELQEGRLRVIKDFGKTREDSCEAELSDSQIKAAVISYTATAKGEMPKLHVDNYRASCSPDEKIAKWSFLSSGEMPDE
jgi:hypothetical protein